MSRTSSSSISILNGPGEVTATLSFNPIPGMMTDEQRLFFETNGYLVIPDAVSPDELGAAQDAARRAEATWREDVSRPGGRGGPLIHVQAPLEYDDRFLDFMEHPHVFPLVREAL